MVNGIFIYAGLLKGSEHNVCFSQGYLVSCCSHTNSLQRLNLLCRNYTLKQMPFPVNDAAVAMKTQAEKTETALQKVRASQEPSPWDNRTGWLGVEH